MLHREGDQSDGRPAGQTEKNRAYTVPEMAKVTSSPLASITGAVAAIAEAPQMEVPTQPIREFLNAVAVFVETHADGHS
jgi:hypothetical protein